jgi:hypothetical protein
VRSGRNGERQRATAFARTRRDLPRARRLTADVALEAVDERRASARSAVREGDGQPGGASDADVADRERSEGAVLRRSGGLDLVGAVRRDGDGEPVERVRERLSCAAA